MIPFQEAGNNVAQAVSLVNQYWREAEEIELDVPEQNVADRMGWTVEQLAQFSEQYRSLIVYERQLWKDADAQAPPPPTEAQVLIGDAEAPTDEQIAEAIEKADSKLQKGLKKMGLTQEERDEWEALHEFNRDHFKESMDMVSANVARTALKLSVQQKIVADRLIVVRQEIHKEATQTAKRKQWVEEERLLMAQYVEIGDLLRGMQDTWFRGAAQLALIRMRYGNQDYGAKGPPTTKTGRPKFSDHPASPL